MTEQIYTPSAINNLNARDIIDRAYRAAGLPVPNQVDEVSALLRNEPTAHDIAVEYATRSTNHGEDAATLLDEAIAATTRAMAVDKFRDAYENSVDAIANSRIDEIRDQAVADLSTVFTQTVKKFTTAAKRLDQKDPLNREIAFEQDTTEAYKTVLSLLSTLSALTFTSPEPVPGYSQHATRILSIVGIPTITTKEEATRDPVLGTQGVRDAHSPQRASIRALLRDAERDADATLVKVAQGQYSAAKLDLADTDDLRRRTNSASNVNSYAYSTDHRL